MLKLFDEIAKYNSPADKLKLLRGYPYQCELKEVLRLATDPFITFGVTSLDGDPRGNADIFQVLEKLAKRELTGNSARLSLGEACMDTEDQNIVLRIVRKDLRCGIGPSLVLQAYPGLIREFKVMRADKFGGFKRGASYSIEPKLDGLRCLAVVENGSAKLFSRNGNEFTSCDHLKPLLEELAGGENRVFDGELISGNFNQSSSAVRKKRVQDDSTTYHIFDTLTTDEWKNPVEPYYVRRSRLHKLMFTLPKNFPLQLVSSSDVSSETEALRVYDAYLKQGLEGAILKNRKGLYRFKRHHDWMKLKEENDVDLRVESLVEGEGKYAGMLGAAIVKYKGKPVRIGSGWSDAERELFWDNPGLLVHKTIEVHYHQETPDGSLRHPRFYRLREDK